MRAEVGGQPADAQLAIGAPVAAGEVVGTQILPAQVGVEFPRQLQHVRRRRLARMHQHPQRIHVRRRRPGIDRQRLAILGQRLDVPGLVGKPAAQVEQGIDVARIDGQDGFRRLPRLLAQTQFGIHHDQRVPGVEILRLAGHRHFQVLARHVQLAARGEQQPHVFEDPVVRNAELVRFFHGVDRRNRVAALHQGDTQLGPDVRRIDAEPGRPLKMIRRPARVALGQLDVAAGQRHVRRIRRQGERLLRARHGLVDLSPDAIQVGQGQPGVRVAGIHARGLLEVGQGRIQFPPGAATPCRASNDARPAGPCRPAPYPAPGAPRPSRRRPRRRRSGRRRWCCPWAPRPPPARAAPRPRPPRPAGKTTRPGAAGTTPCPDSDRRHARKTHARTRHRRPARRSRPGRTRRDGSPAGPRPRFRKAAPPCRNPPLSRPSRPGPARACAALS